MWVYQKRIGTVGEQWEVGFYSPHSGSLGGVTIGSEWNPIITYPLDNEAGARQMVHFLNGGD